jgi:hypothetical protein
MTSLPSASRRGLAAALAGVVVATPLAVLTAPAAQAATRPLIVTCDDPVGFDTSNEGWRKQTYLKDQVEGFTEYGEVDWTGDQGDPEPGSISSDDPDNGWTEIATPELAPDFSTDYSSLAGKDITFSYKYDAAGLNVDNNVYVALRGANGDVAYFPFKDQVGDTGSWATVTVPVSPQGWVSDFTYDTGPGTTPVSAADFAGILDDLDQVAFSVEGSNSRGDLTRFDQFAVGCDTPAEPIVSCDTGVDFTADNEGWRQQTYLKDGVADQLTSYGEATWIADDGDPGPGSVEVPDLDNGWTELASPNLSITNAVDYSSLLGEDLTFAYKYVTAGQEVTNNVYVGLRDSQGDAVYFPFLDQVAPSGEWATITAPLDAGGWVTGFTYDDGPVGPAATNAQIEAVLSDLDEIVISMEGSNNLGDVTRVDSVAVDCDADEPDPGTDPGDSAGDGAGTDPIDVAAPGTGAAPASPWLPIGAVVAGLTLLAGVALRVRQLHRG